MKTLSFMLLFTLIAIPTYSAADETSVNCDLIEKNLALFKSKRDLVIEQYQSYLRTKVIPQMQEKNIFQIKIGRNN